MGKFKNKTVTFYFENINHGTNKYTRNRPGVNKVKLETHPDYQYIIISVTLIKCQVIDDTHKKVGHRF